MKADINLQKLKSSVALAERLAQKQTTLPVLSCLLIEVGKNSITIKSTNLDSGIQISIPAKTETVERLGVPARTFNAFISQIPDQNKIVHLETSAGNLVVTSARSKGVFKTMPADDFPDIPVVSDGKEYSLPTQLIVRGLSTVSYSAAVSGIKPELSSIYVHARDGQLIFVATDSFRLAEKKIKVSVPATFDDILIPLKNVADINRVLQQIGPTVQVRVNKNTISFSGNDIYAVSRVVDGTFPDYRQIIPKGYVTEAVVLKQDIIDALKISNVFSDKFNQIHFIIDPKAKTFQVETKNGDVGENKTQIDGALSGERLEINFNAKYLSDCFQSMDADSISLQLNGANRPLVMRPVSGEQTFMYLVMPMNR